VVVMVVIISGMLSGVLTGVQINCSGSIITGIYRPVSPLTATYARIVM
jgi:hypothetical protein